MRSSFMVKKKMVVPRTPALAAVGRSKRKERLRREILDAASQLFGEEGYELVTVRKIAERVDYSQSVIYTYFRDKADILDTICTDTFAALLAHFEEMSRSKSDPEERLLTCSRELIHFGRTHPHHFRTVFLAPRERNGSLSGRVIEEIGEPLFRSFGAVFRECIGNGIFSVKEAHVSAVTWWANVVGLTAFLVVYEDTKALPNREEMIEESLSVLIHGLKHRTIGPGS